jgi:predicted TIM-barrel fold metal-dependent hydrolase
VIDAHIHLWPSRDFMPAEVWDTYHWVWGRNLRTRDATHTATLLEAAFDNDGSRLIAEMDQCGIAASVIMPMDFGLAAGEAAITIETKNRRLADIAAASNGRVFTFCGVDPRRSVAPELFERAVTEWGAIGLKLYPPTGFHPEDDCAVALYDVAARLRVPVLFHSGVVGYPLRSRFSRPSEIEGIAAEYPDLRIILGHIAFGRAWIDEAVDVARFKPNLLVEASGLRALAPTAEQLAGHLRPLIDALGADRVLFGTDRVGMGGAHGGWLKEWLRLDGDLVGSPRISREELDAVLSGNANRELRLGRHLADPGIEAWPPYPLIPRRLRSPAAGTSGPGGQTGRRDRGAT